MEIRDGLKKNVAYDLYFELYSTNGVDLYTTALAAGDIKESDDDGVFGSITPTLTQSFYWKMAFSAGDMNVDDKIIKIVDQTGPKAFMDKMIHLKMGEKPVNVTKISDDETAANNLELACDNYSVTRGLTGTALPAVAADGAGGVPISDTGGLDLDTILGRITANVALASICTEARLAELAAANLPTDIDLLLTRLSETIAFTGGNVHAHTKVEDNIDFGATKKASINTEMVDTLNGDTYAEPGQENPASTNSLAAKINYMFKSWLNKKTNDGATEELFNAAGAVVDQKTTVSEAAGKVTKGKFVTGP